jgi:GTPase
MVRATQLDADILIFSQDLNPGLARRISDITGLKIIDRTQLILDVFALRAKSQDGKIQVELAQLKYTLPRLVEMDTMMSRLTGGIGGRGPGETKLEINRRRAEERIHRLEKDIESLARKRFQKRNLRKRSNIPIVSIVGYTNAGKSTLLNTLTKSSVIVEDKPFSTLDPASRRLRFPREREIVVTDTVGFIRDLPKDLLNAFRATLEEIGDADLILHVVDISNRNFRAHIEAVETILKQLNFHAIPQILVVNKIDRVEKLAVAKASEVLKAIPISALDSSSLGALMQAMEKALWPTSSEPTSY